MHCALFFLANRAAQPDWPLALHDPTLDLGLPAAGIGRGRPIERFKWRLVTGVLGLPRIDVICGIGEDRAICHGNFHTRTPVPPTRRFPFNEFPKTRPSWRDRRA